MVRKLRSDGKSSHTRFELIASSQDYNFSLIRCVPLTGRSHQIRVHLEMNGLPIIGDKKYGRCKRNSLPETLLPFVSSHHLLHAFCISFKVKERGSFRELQAPLPPNFKPFLNLLDVQFPFTRKTSLC